jgi:hypothetical protein
LIVEIGDQKRKEGRRRKGGKEGRQRRTEGRKVKLQDRFVIRCLVEAIRRLMRGGGW